MLNYDSLFNKIKVYTLTQFMKVTIITPCYNAEKTIASTLESVSNAMRFCDSNIVFEHIVVDGASNDRTLDIVKNFPNVQIFSKAYLI